MVGSQRDESPLKDKYFNPVVGLGRSQSTVNKMGGRSENAHAAAMMLSTLKQHCNSEVKTGEANFGLKQLLNKNYDAGSNLDEVRETRSGFESVTLNHSDVRSQLTLNVLREKYLGKPKFHGDDDSYASEEEDEEEEGNMVQTDGREEQLKEQR